MAGPARFTHSYGEHDMDDLIMSADTEAALTELTSVIEKIVPGSGTRDELVVAINSLIDARLADVLELIADRVEEATGVRP